MAFTAPALRAYFEDKVAKAIQKKTQLSLEGRTLLHRVCYFGFNDLKQILINNGFDPLKKDNADRAPEDYEHFDRLSDYQLIAAVRSKDPNSVRKVLNKRPDLIEFEDIENNKALTYAALLGQKEIAKILLEHGADPYAYSSNSYNISIDPEIKTLIDTSQMEHRAAPYRPQSILIKKMNAYRINRNLDPISAEGYCAGLTTLYLYSMSQGKGQEFADRVQRVLTRHDNNKRPDPEISRFIAEVALLQNPDAYSKDIWQNEMHRSVELLKPSGPKLRQEFKLAFSFSQQELSQLLNELPNHKMIYIGSPDHAIGIYKGENDYFVYDPNESASLPKPIQSPDYAAYLVKTHMGYAGPSEYLPLEIHVFDQIDHPSGVYRKPETIVDGFLQSNPDRERKCAWENYGPLYIAVRANDEAMVEYWLGKGANPNPPPAKSHLNRFSSTLLDWTDKPHILAMLLKNGADPLQKNHYGISALQTAIHHGKPEKVKLLLTAAKAQFQAEVYINAMQLALSKKNFGVGWEIFKAGFKAMVAPLFNPTATKPASSLSTPLLAAHQAQQGAAAGTGLGKPAHG